MAKETINSTKADETTAWRLRLAEAWNDISCAPAAFMLSQCVSVTTKGPPQGQLAAGSRHLSCELRSEQPLAMPWASEQPRQQTSSASSRSGFW